SSCHSRSSQPCWNTSPKRPASSCSASTVKRSSALQERAATCGLVRRNCSSTSRRARRARRYSLFMTLTSCTDRVALGDFAKLVDLDPATALRDREPEQLQPLAQCADDDVKGVVGGTAIVTVRIGSLVESLVRDSIRGSREQLDNPKRCRTELELGAI